MYDNLKTPEDRAAYVAEQARFLVELANELGVTIRINVAPLQPLAMGNTEHVVEAWPARHGPKIPA